MLINQWMKKEPAVVKFPQYTRDNIHVSLLAEFYESFCRDLLEGDSPLRKVGPSQYAESMLQFTERIQREVKKRTKLTCDIRLEEEMNYDEPLVRTNTDAWDQFSVDWNEEAAWDDWVNYYVK